MNTLRNLLRHNLGLDFSLVMSSERMRQRMEPVSQGFASAPRRESEYVPTAPADARPPTLTIRASRAAAAAPAVAVGPRRPYRPSHRAVGPSPSPCLLCAATSGGGGSSSSSRLARAGAGAGAEGGRGGGGAMRGGKMGGEGGRTGGETGASAARRLVSASASLKRTQR